MWAIIAQNRKFAKIGKSNVAVERLFLNLSMDPLEKGVKVVWKDFLTKVLKIQMVQQIVQVTNSNFSWIVLDDIYSIYF